MADEIISRDANRVTVLAGVTDDSAQEIVQLPIDPATGRLLVSATGVGDVVGPASSTDNAIVRFDGTTGKLIQNSTISISDAGILAPVTTDTGALGSTTLMWSDLFLASGAVVNFNNGDVTITNSPNTLTFAGASSGYIFDATVSAGAIETITYQGIPLTAQLQANSTGSYGLVSFINHNDTATLSGTLYGHRSRGTAGSPTIVQNGDAIFTFGAMGYDGVDWAQAASIQFLSDGVPGSNVMPGKIVFSTSPAGSQTVAAVLTLDAAKLATFAGGAKFTDAISPVSSDGAALGSTSLMWSDLFLASGGVINWNNGNTTLTQSAATLNLAGRLVLSGNQSFTAASANAYLYHENVSGLVMYGAGSTDDITIANGAGANILLVSTGTTIARFFGSIRPDSDDLASLGISGTAWSDLFLASGGVINFNAGNYTMTHSAGLLTLSGDLTVQTNMIIGGNATAASVGVEFGNTAGGTPYFDFKRNNVDYDARLILASDLEMDILFRQAGSSFGVGGNIYSTGTLSVNSGTAAFSVTNVGVMTLGYTALTTDASITVNSKAKAFIVLAADSDNVTETDTAYVKYSQDGALAVYWSGANGSPNILPDGSAYTGLNQNDFVLGSSAGTDIGYSIIGTRSTTQRIFQQCNGNTGVTTMNSWATTAIGFDINFTNTTGNVIDVSGTTLTTGSTARFHDNGADTGTRTVVTIHNDNAAATGTTALTVTQDSTGLAVSVSGATSLQGGLIQKARNVASTTVTVAVTDTIVISTTGGGAVAASLPASPETGRVYTIKDGVGDAGTNNITITPAAGNIDGAGTKVINANYGSWSGVYNGTQWLTV